MLMTIFSPNLILHRLAIYSAVKSEGADLADFECSFCAGENIWVLKVTVCF